jgi:hypothetical protein
LVERDYVRIEGNSVGLTDQGARWAEGTGLLPADCRDDPRHLRLCLDWTERRFHFAGRLAGAILRHLLETRCLKRGDERSLIVTQDGKAWFGKLGIDTEGSLSVERRRQDPGRRPQSEPVNSAGSR